MPVARRKSRCEDRKTIRLGDADIAIQREGCVVRRTANDVGSHSQPIRLERRVTRPGLKVGIEGTCSSCDWSRSRQPEEGAGIQLDLWHEEIVIGGKTEGIGECHVELNFFSRRGSVPTGGLAGHGMDAARCHAIAGGECVGERIGGEGQRCAGDIA